MLFFNGVSTMQTDTRIKGGGWLFIPEELETKLLTFLPFVKYTVDGDVIIAVEDDTAAREAWANPQPDMAELRADKLVTLSTGGNIAITSGVTVTLPSTGDSEHFSLQETDQINLTTALTAVEQGVTGYPYHADGQLCRIYPAEDIMAISQAALQHKLYHTTYCNHLLMWARRAETIEELNSITYGSELPKDLGNNMKQVLEAMGVEWKVSKE